jgi:hypothetical protein
LNEADDKEENMKKYILIVAALAAAVVCFAEGFDDMPYSNPDFMTYFQQEITSLIQFQTENNINVPFFVSLSGRSAYLEYKPEYVNYLYSGVNGDTAKNDEDAEILVGFQFRPHRAVYIPLVLTASYLTYQSFLNDNKPSDVEGWVPAEVMGESSSWFLGSGVVINTDVVKGGIYAGYGSTEPMTLRLVNGESDESWDNTYKIGKSFSGFKVILVPLVNTQDWKSVGNALNNILGYLDTGNLIAVTVADQDKGNSRTSKLAKTINAGLDLAFNKIHFDRLSLKANTVYSRGNYDAKARNDTYGLRIQGQFSGFPLGFSLEGGYKRFFGVPWWLKEDYPGTGYFNGSVYFPFKHVTPGIIYRYDNIYKSRITFAVSTNFLSGLFTLNPVEQYMDKNKFSEGMGFDFGARFRWGGWKAGKESNK